MAEKVSMLIVVVDLDCHKCYDKMRKILCKLQDQERIRTISFDDKGNTIAIAGPFDPQRLACKIRCRGGKTVKDVQIVDVGGGGGNGKPPPPAPGPGPDDNGKKKKKKQKGKKKPADAEQPPPQPSPPPAPDMPPSPPPQPATPDRGMISTMTPYHEDQQRARPAELETLPPPSAKEKQPPEEYYMPPTALPPPAMKPTPPLCSKPPPEQYPGECVIPSVEIPSRPVGPCGRPCCAPRYEGYYEGCRCGCGGGGRLYGCSAAGPPAVAWCGYRGYRIIVEEDPNPACSIM